MGYLKNQEFLAYCLDRQAWCVDRGDTTTTLLPYEDVVGTFKLTFAAPAPNANAPIVVEFGKPIPCVDIKPVSAQPPTPGCPGSH